VLVLWPSVLNYSNGVFGALKIVRSVFKFPIDVDILLFESTEAVFRDQRVL